MLKSKSPYIHLIKTINGFYCFDVNTNQLIQITYEAYTYLTKVLNGDIAYSEKHPNICFYIERGYLSTQRVKKLNIVQLRR